MREANEDADADRAEIQKVTAELLAAVNSSDYRRLLAVWSDEGILMPPQHAEVRGRSELGEVFHSWKLALDIWNSDRPVTPHTD